MRKQSKQLIQAISFLLIQSFFLLNICFAADDQFICAQATLSPQIQLDNNYLQPYFLSADQTLSDSGSNDLRVNIYNARNNKADMEVFAVEQGYRVKISIHRSTPVILHWGINNWQKAPKEIWPDTSRYKTYVYHNTQAVRTELLVSPKNNEYEFNIDIPQELIKQINNLDFIFYYPRTQKYGKTDNNGDYSVPVRNALEIALDKLRNSQEPGSDNEKQDLISLLQTRLSSGNDSARADDYNLPIYYEAHENIISQVVKVRDGIRVDFWVASNEQPILHWGINNWQRPPRNIWPDKFLHKTRFVKGDKSVQTKMRRISEDGLYGATMYIPDRDLKAISNIDFNIHYPHNGHWDNNGYKNYALQLRYQDMMSVLLDYARGRISAHINPRQARDLLKNMAFSLAREMDYSELLQLFKGVQDTDHLAKQQEDVLGLILATKLLNEGAVWDSARNKFIISKEKTTDSIRELVDNLDPLSMSRCLYLFGMIDASWTSRLVHGLDYKQIYEDTASGRIKDLGLFLQQFIDSYDEQTGAPKILAANPINEDKLFLTLQFGQEIISTIIGYPTKSENYFHQGKEIKIREIWGNEFSSLGLKLAGHVDKSAIQAQISRGHDKGIKFVVDWIPWKSLDMINRDNYRFYHHKILAGDIDVQKILEQQDNFAEILKLSEHKYALIYNRMHSADQPKPDLTPDTESGEYWRDYYLNYLKYFIDEFAVDGFRVDLPGELQEYGDYSVFQSACFEAIDYAVSKKKKIYFLLEGYGEEQWARFSGWNSHEQIVSQGYRPFRCYYKPVMDGILKANAFELRHALQRVTEGMNNYILSLTNYDEMHAEHLIPDEVLLKRYSELWACFVCSGYDALIYLRDLGIGDIVPVVGGNRIIWGGAVKYYTHKFATKTQFRDRMEKSTGELVADSPVYQAFNQQDSAMFSQIFFRGNKIIFYQPGKVPVVFDLDKMIRGIQPIPVADMERDIGLWLKQYVYSIADINKQQKTALEIIQSAISREDDIAAAGNAAFKAVSAHPESFARWDWEKNKSTTLFISPEQVLTINNKHGFVVAIREKGKSGFRTISSLNIENSSEYIALFFGLNPGKYEINFLWPNKHAEQGWEGESWHEIEVLPRNLSKALSSYNNGLPRPTFLLDEWQPLAKQDISLIKTHRDKLFLMQIPLFSGRQKNGQHKGIGKFTDYAAACKKYNQATGANAFMTLPINPTLDEANSPYSPASNYALNEAFIDWDSVIARFFPQLNSQKPPFIASKGSVDYQSAAARDSVLGKIVYAEFLKQSNDAELKEELKRFDQRFAWWLNDYCKFRVFSDILKSPWWQWTEEQMQQTEKSRGFRQQIGFYKLSQLLALKQWQKLTDDIHAFGGKILYDKPYFCAVNSVEVWTSFRDNKGYFLDISRHPGVNGKKLQIFNSLALYDYINLAKMERPYELILKDHEYKLDVLGFDGGRLDALHMAYPWGDENLRSGDEPGDELLEAIKSVYDRRGNSLIIAEQLGAEGAIVEKIRALGFTTMEHLEWLWFKDNIMLSLTSHDEARVGERYGGWTEAVYKKSAKKVFDLDPEIISWTVGDEVMDEHRINNPYLEEDQMKELNWRYLIPHPGDPDYNQRVKADLSPYIRGLSAEYLGDWDELFSEGKYNGLNSVIAPTTEMTRNMESTIDYILRYNYGQDILRDIKAKRKKEIFQSLYTQISRDAQGKNSLLHHGHERDFFKLAESVLESIPGLSREEAPDVWQYIDYLKATADADSREYKQISANIRLLGFMTGLFEKIEQPEIFKSFESRINLEPELLVGQAI